MAKFFIPVKGGLGNQMFFYAFSLYLKDKKIPSYLVWDEYAFTKQHNGVELYEAFNISIGLLTRIKINFLIKINKSSLPFAFKRILGRVSKYRYLSINVYTQTTPYSYDNILSITEDKKIFVDGYWQNHQYVNSIKDILLETFEFKLPSNFSKDYLNKIRNCNSVSLHIRRGDYLDPQFANLNVIKSNDYYTRAIELIKEKISSPLFFIFTDDVAWAKKEFISKDFVFIEGNVNKLAYLDMYLMSQCKHNIIANSTFSWWGAWLNRNASKIVIAPDYWTLEVLSSQFCPPDWKFLEVK